MIEIDKLEEKKPWVALNKNHCHHPLLFPATKELRDITLLDGTELYGIGEKSKDGKSAYAIAFEKGPLKEIKPLTTFDGQILFGLLQNLQLKNGVAKKNNPDGKSSPVLSISFKSIYSLLKYLDLPTNKPDKYARTEEALHKIFNTSIYFQNNFYSARKKKVLTDTHVFRIFSHLAIHKEKGAVDFSIDIEFSKRWYSLHESYFIEVQLDLFKQLSAPELNLAIELLAWSDSIDNNGNPFKMGLNTLCDKIGYKRNKPSVLKRYIGDAIIKINSKCDKEYKAEFKKDLVVISSKKGRRIKTMKRVRSGLFFEG